MANAQGMGRNELETEDNSGEMSISDIKNNILNKKVTEKYRLSEHYDILTDKPLPQFNSAVAKAFEVTDRKNKQYLFAVILPNNLPIRFGALQKLKKIFHPNFCNIVDAGFVDIAQGKFGNFAILCERPQGVPLKDYIPSLERAVREDGTKDYFLPEQFIAQKIVEPINEILKLFKDDGLSYGCLNHDKIYIETIDGAVRAKLLEPLSEPCGLSQLLQYETISRAQTIPIGKGESKIEDDYFALGVLVYYCMFGESPSIPTDTESFIFDRLENGTYTCYLGNIEITSRMVDSLRGLLSDLPEERWGHEETSEWVRGKRFNLIRPTYRKESQRSYVMKEKKHYTRRSLAYHFFCEWDEAASELRSKKIIKWLELAVGSAVVADEVAGLITAAGEEKARARKSDNELISKALLCLDPPAPIRFKNLAIQIDGLGPFLADAWFKRNQTDINGIKEIFSLNLPDYKVVKDLDTDRSSDRWLLQRLNNFIAIDSYGFGLERCLYDLNPGLPCQSTLLGNTFIIDLNHLIHHLNDNSAELSKFDPVDRHIAAFVACRLEMTKPLEPAISGLFLTSKLRERVIKLTLLSYVQKKTTISRLNGLAEWIVELITPDFTVYINSKSIRESFEKEMQKAAKTGILSNIIDVINNPNYFMKNKTDLIDAKTEYNALVQNLRILEKSLADAKKYKTFHLTGLYLAKVLSILVFVLVISAVSL